MVTKRFIFLLIILLSMVGIKAIAYDFAVENTDGVTIYYNYINNGKELEVTYSRLWHEGNSYAGVVNIPDEVTFMNQTRKVTGIGEYSFYKCYNLTSIRIPNIVNYIGDYAFSYCRNLTSVNIPKSTIKIGRGAFSESKGLTSIILPNSLSQIDREAFQFVDLTTVICLGETPATIFGNSDYRSFSKNTFYNATLFVPTGTIDKYKAANGWKDFNFIKEGDGSDNNTTGKEKCEMPSIIYNNNKLTFITATEGAVCHSTITDADIASYTTNEVQLGVTYNISVYATKSGYENSETATATLCWIGVDPKTEGITSSVANVRAMPLLIQSNGNVLKISGAPNGSEISVFNLSGQNVGSAIVFSECTDIISSLQIGEIGIVKIGEKAVKVVVK